MNSEPRPSLPTSAKVPDTEEGAKERAITESANAKAEEKAAAAADVEAERQAAIAQAEADADPVVEVEQQARPASTCPLIARS